MQRIGIMQGRLLPPPGGRFQCFPREGWASEFALAAQAGLDSIEWIYDAWGEDANPISSDQAIGQVGMLSQQSGVAVVSLCADYFMDRPLIRTSPAEKRERVERLIWVVARCHRLGIRRIVLPFVDDSRICSDQEKLEVVAILRDVLPVAAKNGVEIHLETSLDPAAFARLLDQLPFANAKANYDSGNSASLGYDFRDELAAYGERIGSVHIKDRVRGGGTVPLGEGDADIPGVLGGLQRLGFSGDFILQTARGRPGLEVDWARHNRSLVSGYLHPAVSGANGRSR
jgi:L-ribulose-5-phosphate 3-epimerase